jgi:hypothetical protein
LPGQGLFVSVRDRYEDGDDHAGRLIVGEARPEIRYGLSGGPRLLLARQAFQP